MATRIELKRGLLGDVYCQTSSETPEIVRDLSKARWLWLARHLACREAKALIRLNGVSGFPRLIALEKNCLTRSYLPGEVMFLSLPPSRTYFRQALGLVRRLHRNRIAHNDLAKEANWICGEDGKPGIVDFQLSICFSKRSALFRLLAREDLRHLLKHKRHYRPESLTQRELRILEYPMWPARLWRIVVKPCYNFWTRRLLGWPEREGAAERQRPT